MDDKKNFICKMIEGNLNNDLHTKVFNIVNVHNYKYTENINGIFINLEIINDDVINEIYNLIKNTKIINEDENDTKENYKIDEDKVNKKKDKKIKVVLKDIYLKDFTNSEKEIIKYSKQYFL